MVIAGVVAIFVVIAFATGFPWWLSQECFASQGSKEVPGTISINREYGAQSGSSPQNPSVTKFPLTEFLLPPNPQNDRTYGTYSLPKEPYEWGRRFWCEVNASDYFIALFTLMLGIATGFLWWSTHRVWIAGEAQIKIAARTADVAIRAQLPILRIAYPDLYSTGPVPEGGSASGGSGISGVPQGNCALDRLSFVNQGKTPAFLKKVFLGWYVGDVLPAVPPALLDQVPIQGGEVVEPWESNPERGPHYYPDKFIIRLSAEQDSALLMGQNLWVFVRSEFRDFMGEPRVAKTCWRWGRDDAASGDFFFLQGRRRSRNILPSELTTPPPPRGSRSIPMPENTGTAYDFIRIDILDPKCGKTGKYRLREAVENENAICAYCGGFIDLSSEDWRSILSKLAEEYKQIKPTR